MTESPTSIKISKWNRPLIGGLLSALPAAILGSVFIFELNISGPLEDITYIVFLGFVTPVILIGSAISNEFAALFIMVLIWFLIGAIIARLTSKNIIAVICWAVIPALFVFAAMALCLVCQ